MKKYLTAGLLAACLTTPAFAVDAKHPARSPDQPLSHRSVALCIAALIGLHAYKRRLTRDQVLLAAYLR